MMKYRYIILAAFAAVLLSCGKDIPEEGPEDSSSKETVPFTSDVLARIEITTDNGAAVDSKEKYRACSVKVSGKEEYAMEVRGKIRGRGNSTWKWYPKKPYRIKLEESASFLGLAPDKDWVLLADYRDVTHMMNLVGFYLANELGLPHTNHVRYATVSLNGEEMGLYMITEQVEEGDNRVKLDSDKGILLTLDINDGPADEPDATDNFWSEVFNMAAAVKYPKDAAEKIRDYVKEEF